MAQILTDISLADLDQIESTMDKPKASKASEVDTVLSLEIGQAVFIPYSAETLSKGTEKRASAGLARSLAAKMISNAKDRKADSPIKGENGMVIKWLPMFVRTDDNGNKVVGTIFQRRPDNEALIRNVNGNASNN